MYLKQRDEELVIVPADLKQTFQNKFTLNIGKNEIIKMKDNNVITDRDLKIAKFLFRFKFATAEQIHKYLGEESSKVNIKNRLDKLVNYRVLNKFMLSEFEEERIAADAFEIYCLDLGGRYLLSHYSNEDTTDWYSTVNMKTSEIISKNLVVSEFYIRIMQTCGSKIVYFKPEPELRVGKKNVIPSFEMCMQSNGITKYFIGEIVREYDFPIFIREKAVKLESLLNTNAWKKYYYDSESEPVLFMFADSDLTALETGKLLTETTEIRNFRLSTDERIGRELYDTGAFLKYVEDKDSLQEIKAGTFKP
ncbi:hypothetical protein [Paenibacillus polymyxa]|uniref:Uncharacterized protein n=1 Tax=Paenibacillus polymyxa (strain SC2) TaxID=886882 RepID=E3EKR9_PAEPS|nr:hypothetical protein [Paenibacillus polymyxa]ADO59520.1 hypothetical protein PPSC2_27495 [Paenibacillus polymyxa SC2]WPQ59647.1 hypothetical protein SKN87_28715 [Paenibacillus polymyxa]